MGCGGDEARSARVARTLSQAGMSASSGSSEAASAGAAPETSAAMAAAAGEAQAMRGASAGGGGECDGPCLGTASAGGWVALSGKLQWVRVVTFEDV